MNKKVYIKPNSKQTIISNESLLENSIVEYNDNIQGDGGGDGVNIPEAESKLFNWNSFDEF